MYVRVLFVLLLYWVLFCVVSCVCSCCLCGMSVFVSYVWVLLVCFSVFVPLHVFLFVFEYMCLRMCVDNLFAVLRFSVCLFVYVRVLFVILFLFGLCGYTCWELIVLFLFLFCLRGMSVFVSSVWASLVYVCSVFVPLHVFLCLFACFVCVICC